MRMQELDDLERNKSAMRSSKTEKKDFVQFSRVLIFINFHPKGEEWFHQEYMDDLKNPDSQTQRMYPTPATIKKVCGSGFLFRSLRSTPHKSNSPLAIGEKMGLMPGKRTQIDGSKHVNKAEY